jgi:CxxC motif-containing protein (DUF1111 family)
MVPFVRLIRPVFVLLSIALAVLLIESSSRAVVPFTAQDPGLRQNQGGAGPPLADLTPVERQYFSAGHDKFRETASVQGTVPGTRSGLGPRFNLDSCGGCHAQPHFGGTSPAVNPQVAMATKEGATNEIPAFITKDGPIREARMKFKADGTRDGGVHALFTISGRTDAPGCYLTQPDFRRAAVHDNLSFRIPTPMFGAGLIEAIDDDAILANMQANSVRKHAMGIGGRPNSTGRPNISENDGTVTRFGWKAQNKSLELFVAEAFNVEQGITSDLFPQERDDAPACRFNATPESPTHVEALAPMDVPSDVVKAAFFARFLAPPRPVPDDESIVRGRKLFGDIGCVLCHTPTLHTGKVGVAVLQNKDANLYSDLLLHNMGQGLADGIIQGNAAGDEFRTAPLWGAGERIFFLHDGRTKDLLQAIQAHAGHGDGRYPPSEANQVVAQFNRLTESDKQHILNFLRGL